VKGPRNS